jgi:hypothetical protein
VLLRVMCGSVQTESLLETTISLALTCLPPSQASKYHGDYDQFNRLPPSQRSTCFTKVSLVSPPANRCIVTTSGTFQDYDAGIRMNCRSEKSGKGLSTRSMETRVITPQKADEILREWARRSLKICFAVVVGELAWHSQCVGVLHSGGRGRWIVASGQITNTLSTDQYQEITLTEDDELLGIRFARAVDVLVGFEVDLFIDKHDGLPQDLVPLIGRIIQ